ncbi:MAG: ARPP-1 family domain-containing protein [Promethearchaeota archaeon]
MKSEIIQKVESLFENPLKFLKLGTPQVYKNMTVIPIIIREEKFINFITIKEAEELNLIEIIESDKVNQLEVINKSNKQILIPFGMTVHGGKQDRTIWEPILLSTEGKQNVFNQNPKKTVQKYTIPAKCVEQSRWNYRGGRSFKSSNMRLHPNVAYEAISSGGQSGVWQEIQSHRAEMGYNRAIAPTESYLEMIKVSNKYTETFIKNFKNIKNQCGVAVFISGEFIGIEFYANPKAWKNMSNDILKAFSIEAIRFKNITRKNGNFDYHDELIKKLHDISFNFSTREGVGLGNVVDFNSNNGIWRGITLIHNDTMIQFYLVKKRGGFKIHKRPNLQFQTVIGQRYQI